MPDLVTDWQCMAATTLFGFLLGLLIAVIVGDMRAKQAEEDKSLDDLVDGILKADAESMRRELDEWKVSYAKLSIERDALRRLIRADMK